MSLHVHRYRPVPKRLHKVPHEFAGAVVDPFEKSFSFGTRGPLRWGLAIALSGSVQVGLLLLAIFHTHQPPAPVHKEIPIVVAVVKPPPPPAAPTPPPPPPPEEPKPRPRMARNAPPPQAQAGKVITRAADPSEPVDMSGFSMVTGESSSYAGGISSTLGTSKKAVTDVHAMVKAPVRRVAAPAAPSQARAPTPSRDDWSCAWPDEEQESELNDARVAIQVSVDRDGAAERVEIINSPKPSFAEAARRCAMGESYRPALDEKGDRIPASTKPFLVHFLR